MRKARIGALLLLSALPCAAQRGAEPELVPRFAPLKQVPVAEPLKPAPEERVDEPVYKILPGRDDLMRKPRASELGAKAERREFLRVRARAWFFSGGNYSRVSSRIAPGSLSPAGAEAWHGNTQTFDSRGMMALYSAEFAPVPWVSIQVEHGRDASTKAPYRDRYWVHAPEVEDLTYTPSGAVWHKPDHEEDLVYGGTSRGEADWAAATLYFRVVEARIAGQDDDAFRHVFDMGPGIHRLRLRHRVKDLEVIKGGGRYHAAKPVGPVAGYDSTYEALWRGAHLAVRDTVKFPRRFHLEGEAFWAPMGMEFRGDGRDNSNIGLGGLRAEGPNYEDRARGAAIHFRFAGGWSWKRLSFDAGYQRLYFYSRTGKRRFHNFDGTKTDANLDVAAAELDGFFAGASFRF